MNTTDAPLRDTMIPSADLPWVPQAEGVWFKPLRISTSTGSWVNLIRMAPHGRVNRHRHIGAVEGWVLAGSWRYLEHDWTAAAGAYVFEPAGDVHTLVVEGDEEMITLFHVHGPIEYLDEAGEIVRVETAQSKLDLYREHCAAHGLELDGLIV
jgi:quercetin dioxygenase-like cupin family protein